MNIFVAGHRGMVGSAIVRELERSGTDRSQIITRTREELDLVDQRAVLDFFKSASISQVYLAAARVGGIYANDSYPADFIYDNLMIEANVIHSAFTTGVKKLLFLGSSCIYPKFAEQPIKESELLMGALEPSNEPYAIAKIAGIKLCESYNRQYGATHGLEYRSLMPSNLYGTGDNYHPQNSHVIPALLRRFHEARMAGNQVVEIWGTGTPLREFTFVDDVASACIQVMAMSQDVYSGVTEARCSHLNVGSGEEVSIRTLAEMIADTVGFEGEIRFNTSMPDGTPRKLMDSARLRALGWSPKHPLQVGLKNAYADFIRTINSRNY